jgi:hypothetical protein
MYNVHKYSICMVREDDAVGSFFKDYDNFICVPEAINQRQRDRQPSTPDCPQVACWPMGTNKVKKCTARKIIFCTGLTRAAQAGQKSIVPERRVQRTNQGRTPFICPL